jgi:hypothetical protein
MRKLLMYTALGGLAVLLGQYEAEAAQVQIQLRGSDDPANDYIAWSPVPATIRVSDPAGLAGDLQVVLSNGATPNQPCGGPGHGAAVFAATVAPGETAAADSLSLTLPRDGKPVPFMVAGKFKCASIGAKDAVIQVRRAAGAALGAHDVMVRVRKDVETLTPAERQIYLEALRAMKLRPSTDPHSFEGFVRTHRLSSLGKRLSGEERYLDQAHGGPAFLAWHRAYLLEFERELQKIDPRVALPYWRIWQPLPTMPKLFAVDFLGANSIDLHDPSTPELSVFADTNPLFGWAMPYDNDGQPAGLTPLYRYKVDWKQPQSYSIEGPDGIARQMAQPSFGIFSGLQKTGIEQDPHNVGHNTIGPWMQDCTISPSDPAFWLFHTEHDRLWAQWQYTQGRFGNKGENRDDYYIIPQQRPGDPNYGHFDPKAPKCTIGGWDCPVFGHNLFDTMWPWDGITGHKPDDVMARRRPPTAELGIFPHSAVPGLWPAQDARPRPADVIDYAGVTDRSTDLGFSYDDVPFGRAAQSTAVPSVSVASALLTEIPDTARVAPRSLALAATAAPGALAEDPAAHAELARVLARREASPEARRAALRFFEASEDEALLPALGRIVAEHDAARPELARHAMDVLGALMMTHDAFALAKHHEIMAVGHAALAHPDPETRSAAARLLLGMGDDRVVEVLRAALAHPSAVGFSRVEAILQLGAVGNHRHGDIIRPYLTSPELPVRLAAIQVLAGDSRSNAARVAILADPKTPLGLRAAALDSLMLNDPSLPERAAAIAADERADPSLRRRALAALGGYVLANRAQLSEAYLGAIKAKVATLAGVGLPQTVLDNVKATVETALASR